MKKQEKFSVECPICGRKYIVRHLMYEKKHICPDCYQEKRKQIQKLGLICAKAHALKISDPAESERLAREMKKMQVELTKYF